MLYLLSYPDRCENDKTKVILCKATKILTLYTVQIKPFYGEKLFTGLCFQLGSSFRFYTHYTSMNFNDYKLLLHQFDRNI